MKKIIIGILVTMILVLTGCSTDKEEERLPADPNFKEIQIEEIQIEEIQIEEIQIEEILTEEII